MPNIESSSYINSLITQLLKGKCIIVYDIFKPKVDSEITRIGINVTKERYKTVYSQNRRRYIVEEWEYKI